MLAIKKTENCMKKKSCLQLWARFTQLSSYIITEAVIILTLTVALGPGRPLSLHPADNANMYNGGGGVNGYRGELKCSAVS